jgi:hypothetical protein
MHAAFPYVSESNKSGFQFKRRVYIASFDSVHSHYLHNTEPCCCPRLLSIIRNPEFIFNRVCSIIIGYTYIIRDLFLFFISIYTI